MKMKINNQFLFGFSFILTLIISVNCQYETTAENVNIYNEIGNNDYKYYRTIDIGNNNKVVVDDGKSNNQLKNTKTLDSKNRTISVHTTSVKTSKSSSVKNTKKSTSVKGTTTKTVSTSVVSVTPAAVNSTDSKPEMTASKAKAEAIEKYPIESEDLTLLKWNEFDYNGFKITISTPKVFDDNTIVNIKWQIANNVKPSSSIKIELHTNLTRRNDYIVYPTTETITIDDNVPKNIHEVNWNPNIKFKKEEKYYIRIWSYINNNTATMSGLCIWSINDVLPEKEEEVKVTKKSNTVKTIAVPCIGALLSFTVIGHFVMQSRQNKRYYKQCSDEESVCSQDGLNDNKGESNYYNTIQIDVNEGNGYHQLPQLWQLEAKKKQNNNVFSEVSLSDNDNENSINKEVINNLGNVEINTDKPISLIIEKPTQQKLQKITKYEIDNNTYQNRSFQEHRLSNSSHNSDINKSDDARTSNADIRRSIINLFRKM